MGILSQQSRLSDISSVMITQRLLSKVNDIHVFSQFLIAIRRQISLCFQHSLDSLLVSASILRVGMIFNHHLLRDLKMHGQLFMMNKPLNLSHFPRFDHSGQCYEIV